MTSLQMSFDSCFLEISTLAIILIHLSRLPMSVIGHRRRPKISKSRRFGQLCAIEIAKPTLRVACAQDLRRIVALLGESWLGSPLGRGACHGVHIEENIQEAERSCRGHGPGGRGGHGARSRRRRSVRPGNAIGGCRGLGLVAIGSTFGCAS